MEFVADGWLKASKQKISQKINSLPAYLPWNVIRKLQRNTLAWLEEQSAAFHVCKSIAAFSLTYHQAPTILKAYGALT